MFAADRDRDDSPLLEELGDPRFGIDSAASGRDLVAAQRAQPPHEVFDGIDVPSLPALEGSLQFGIERREHLGIEEFAQLFGPEQIAQHLAIERERRRSAFGEWGIALVHVLGDPAEHERLGKRRRRFGVDGVDLDLAAPQLGEHLAQRRQIEDVVDTLTSGFQQDRKARVVGGDGQQIGGLLPLLPQRGSAIRATTWQQQRPGRGLTEAGSEHRGLGKLGDQQFVEIVGIDHELVDGHTIDGLGQPDHDAVVAPHEFDVPAPLLGQSVLEGHTPGSVDLRAERAEDADPPVADLVSEPLDHDGAIIGHPAGGFSLLAQELHQVRCREPVEAVPFGEPGIGGFGGEGEDLSVEGAHRPAEFERPARSVSVPERHLARLPGCRCDDHSFVGDVFDPPRGRTEQEGLTDARFVDHLFVELTDPSAVGEEHAVEAAVGDGASAGDRQPLGPRAPSQDALDAVPDDPRAQLGELVGRIAAGEQIEHRVECLVGQLGEVGRASDDLGDVVEWEVVECDHGDDLLGKDVERVPGVTGLLDEAGLHSVDHDGGFEQIGPVLREELAPARRADLVTRSTDPLEAATDRTRGLDLDHEVDRTHVDTEFERRGGDEALQGSSFEFVFDDEPLLATERSVVRLDQFPAGFG